MKTIATKKIRDPTTVNISQEYLSKLHKIAAASNNLSATKMLELIVDEYAVMQKRRYTIDL